MTGHRCPICRSPTDVALVYPVMQTYTAHTRKCHECGFFFVADPDWLEFAHSAAIAPVDTGLLARVRMIAPRLSCLFGVLCRPDETFVDFGAGYGVLVREMRDRGFDFRWSDLYAPNLFAAGFEYQGERCAGAVAVEVLEHVSDPRRFLEDAIGGTGARLIVVTTELLPTPIPEERWWYLAPETGQHISFFERRTLGRLARELSLHLRSRGSFHVFSERPIPKPLFLAAATRLAVRLSRITERGFVSFTERDNPLYRGQWD